MISELSIIIPTLNEEKYLPKLLNSIAVQDFQGKMEVIVVDGNSKDQTIRAAKTFKSKITDFSILSLRKRGVSYQRNRGADRAKYKYLLFVDADMVLPRHFLNRFLKKVNAQEQFIDTGFIWVLERDILACLVFIALYPWFLFFMLRDKIVFGFLLLTTRENHLKIHGFREDLKVGEDVDYGWRSVAAGASYHLHFFPFILFSVRRLQKVGRVKLYYYYLRMYIAIKRQGIEAAEKITDYSFGQFGNINGPSN